MRSHVCFTRLQLRARGNTVASIALGSRRLTSYGSNGNSNSNSNSPGASPSPPLGTPALHRDTQYVTSACDPATGALIPPLHLSTTFERDEHGDLSRGGSSDGSKDSGYMYSRLGNPTRRHFEEAFTALELGGGESLAFSSGMQAATALLTASPGAHVVLPDDLYHGVYLIIADILAQWGMTMEKVDFTDHSAVHARLQALRDTDSFTSTGSETRTNSSKKRKLLLWLETPSNPQCKVTDIVAITSMARGLFPHPDELAVVVDSTWATPYLLNPLLLGADFVMHSVTKYIGGHSDVLGGIVTASKAAVLRADGSVAEGGAGAGAPDMLTNLRTIHRVGGGVLGPLEAWMAARGLRTLPVRLNHQCESALKIATALETLPGVQRVFYPGLASHPQHALASAQMRGRYGGMLSLLVTPRPRGKEESNATGGAGGGDGEWEALQVTREVRLFKAATSLGGTESLIEHRRSVEGAHPVSPPNLLRLSVGLESAEDLLQDLSEAIRKATNHY